MYSSISSVVFDTITTVMKHSILTSPKPIQEVQQDIPVTEDEEARIQAKEERKKLEEYQRVRLIDSQYCMFMLRFLTL